MADSVLLSVVVAAYTTERLKDIRDILESLRSQTYQNIEVLFVVDGSAPLLEIMQKMSTELPGLNLQIVLQRWRARPVQRQKPRRQGVQWRYHRLPRR